MHTPEHVAPTGAGLPPFGSSPAAPDAAPLHPALVRARNRPRRALPAEAYGPLLPHLEPGDVTAGRTLPVVLRTARVAAAGGALPTRGAARRPSSSVAASCRAVA